jgi:hypothetical protein
MKTTCAVVVLYEDPTIREVAVAFCDQLMKRFWNKCAFEMSWWSFEELRDPPTGGAAMQRARSAELIVVTVQPGTPFDAYGQAWLETSLTRREEREGVLVGLTGPVLEANERAVEKHIYLRNLAHRSGLDYLTCVPEDIGYEAVDSLESCTERAGQVTTVLTEILRQRESRHSAQASYFQP